MAPSPREASDALQEALQECVVGVNKTISRLLPQTDLAEDRLYEAMRHGVLSGGKRLRPFMVMQSAKLFDVDPARARRVAADARSKNIFERARNLSFESSLVDVTAQVEFNFLPYIHGSKENYFSPYVFFGLTGFHFNPKARLGDEIYELRPLGTEGQFKGEEYHNIHGGVAFGLGMKLDLSYEWSLNFELGVRQLFTDYLDDVSTVYPDKSDLLKTRRGEIAVALSDRSIVIPGANEGPIGEEGRQRGNTSNKDAYAIANIGLV